VSLVGEEVKIEFLVYVCLDEDIQTAVGRGSLGIISPERAGVLDRAVRAEKFSRRTELFFKDALVADVHTDTDRGLSRKIPLHLRLVVVVLHPALPIEVRAEGVIDAPINQEGFRMRLRAVLSEEIVIVRIHAPIE